MKQSLSPTASGIIVVVVILLVGWFLMKQSGPRTDGPPAPVDMGKMMGKGAVAPPGKGGGAPGQPQKMGN